MSISSNETPPRSESSGVVAFDVSANDGELLRQTRLGRKLMAVAGSGLVGFGIVTYLLVPGLTGLLLFVVLAIVAVVELAIAGRPARARAVRCEVSDAGFVLFDDSGVVHDFAWEGLGRIVHIRDRQNILSNALRIVPCTVRVGLWEQYGVSTAACESMVSRAERRGLHVSVKPDSVIPGLRHIQIRQDR